MLSRRHTRHTRSRTRFGDSRKYHCRSYGEGREKVVVHDPRCSPSHPKCRWRRPVCRCEALHYPHRPGSVRGCREGGVPEVLMKSRSFREAYGYSDRRFTRRFSRSRASRW